jgi:tetratricopeptide (TPR) repeat protein
MKQADRFADVQRRGFLFKCCEAAGAFLIPASFRKAAFARSSSPDPEFHLHPHYRDQTPLDAALLQVKPGLDGFVGEQYHDTIAAILNAWSTSLLHSPQNTDVLEKALSGKFMGTSWQAVDSHPLRPVSRALEVRRLRFNPQPSLAPQAFVGESRYALSNFSKILTAEFQITRIDSTSTGLATRVRYELVGTGQGFYREQRIGYWSLDWEPDPQSGYRLVRWQAHDEVRSRSAQPLYVEVTHATFGASSSYTSQMSHGADYWRTVLDGASGIDIYGHNGVSVGDIDGDGLDDIYVCQPAGLPNRLYRNRSDGTFEDITELSGVGIVENTACALFGDFDNDGRQDLVVVRSNGPLLFLNQGNGKFRLKAGAFQFAAPPQGTFTGAAAADYNRDGWLDIYFCLYVYYQGADQYKYPTPYFTAENGPPNFMMHNNGDGTFRDVTAQCGLDKNNTRYSFCCGWGDYNRDGWPDLYVVNDFGRKNLYRNNGDGTFSDVAPQAGVEDVGAGMSVCWLDYDNDGSEDLYVANMWTAAGERITNDNGFQKDAPAQIRALYRKHAMGNSLLRNGADSVFRDVTEESLVGMGRWSWSSDSLDFDHDGFSDIYIANGMISGTVREDLNSFFWRQVIAKSPNTAKPAAGYQQGWNAINELIRADHSWSGFERNVFYANNRDGTFSDVSGALALDFLEDSRAFALSDFDGDGRQEILLKNRNAPQLRLMKNTIPDLPPAIAFRLRGTKSNRDAIGAAVTVATAAGNQTRLLEAGSGFLSQHSKELLFGLGEAKGRISAAIRWPSGLIQQLKDLPPDHRVWVTEGLEPSRIEPFKAHTVEKSVPVRAVTESFPDTVETWLLVPVSAPAFSLTDARGKSWTLSALRGKPVLLSFSDGLHGEWMREGLQLVVVNVKERASDDVAAEYNLLFRYLFDRHRDLPLPASFLIDEHGQIVKVYQGPVDPKSVEKDLRRIPRTDAGRLEKALPFTGFSTMFEFGRNYLSLGSIFFQRGYMESAGDFFQSALKDDPSSAEAFYGLGSVYLKQEKNSQAQECFERAAKLKASYPETGPNAWNNLALLATREGDTAKAISYFEQALQLDPDHVVALDNLGNAYRQQKRWQDARKTLERALAINPADPEANYSLGMVFAQWNDTARAEEYLRKALQARPAYPEALNNLGVLYLRTRRRDAAVGTFEKCIRVAPAFDQSYLNLARVYAIEGDLEKARTVLLALLRQHPNHALAQQALAQLH